MRDKAKNKQTNSQLLDDVLRSVERKKDIVKQIKDKAILDYEDNFNDKKSTDDYVVDTEGIRDNDVSFNKVKNDFDKQLKKIKTSTIIINNLLSQLERKNLINYLVYIQTPLKIIWINLVSGFFKGVGFILGVSIFCILFLLFMRTFFDFSTLKYYLVNIIRIIKIVF